MSIIVWFRQDLRLADNPALAAAAASGKPVVPLYILDPDMMPGGASRWWLHGSLDALARDLRALGAPLVLRRGSARDVLHELAREAGASGVFWNRCYEPDAIARDRAIEKSLASQGLDAASFKGALLREPWEISTAAGMPYKVFTPFWRALAAQAPFGAPLPAPGSLRAVPGLATDDPASWRLRPSRPDWAAAFGDVWLPGERAARLRLAAFLDGSVRDYGEARNMPAREATSRLSPHLHWGEISPRQIWFAAQARAGEQPALAAGVESFLRELGWREFSHYLICHWPHMVDRAWKPAYGNFPWRRDESAFRLWTKGLTGYPIVDAGMRELWRTGYMHNRVRMISASFLVKDLLIDWREGAAWFEDTLVDADLACNRAGWQWVAGSGADAAPFFRIFNPVLQGEKFDADGAYLRRHLPELARLDTRFIHRPWEAPPAALDAAGIVPGKTYPLPIVDHAAARARALAALAKVQRR
jgi:deoxyribodipyrimidine photo-lyase